MSPLWLLALAVGAAGAVALGIVTHRLAGELDGVRRSLRPLRAARPDAATSARGGDARRPPPRRTP